MEREVFVEKDVVYSLVLSSAVLTDKPVSMVTVKMSLVAARSVPKVRSVMESVVYLIPAKRVSVLTVSAASMESVKPILVLG